MTPPNDWALKATTMVRNKNVNVVIRATSSIFFLSNCLTRLQKTGKISRVMTEAMVLASEEVMEKVVEKSDATSNPNSPWGGNSMAMMEYDCAGSSPFGKTT